MIEATDSLSASTVTMVRHTSDALEIAPHDEDEGRYTDSVSEGVLRGNHAE